MTFMQLHNWILDNEPQEKLPSWRKPHRPNATQQQPRQAKVAVLRAEELSDDEFDDAADSDWDANEQAVLYSCHSPIVLAAGVRVSLAAEAAAIASQHGVAQCGNDPPSVVLPHSSMHFDGRIMGRDVLVHIDSGCTSIMINDKLAESLRLELQAIKPIACGMADGSQFRAMSRTRATLTIGS
ncbi:hypothetical protein HK105_206774 [Polyrhizophydium stewartii]|uniref:Uncharacterized protein n=1 Tax=Polyrhizophydium stewartii TaxID=2732419 RepID=A0ABR4N2R6_9FUNG